MSEQLRQHEETMTDILAILKDHIANSEHDGHTDQHISDVSVGEARAAVDRMTQLESLLREASKWCPRSLTGGDELANRIDEALKGGKFDG